MTLNITLDLGHKKELEAFARFCTDLANSSDEIIADIDARQMRLYGPQAQTARLASVVEHEEARDAGGMTQLDRIVEGAEAAGDQFLAGIMAKTEAKATAPARERGAPAPGHARRTKAEIAEDKAADEAEAVNRAAIVKSATDEVAAISTGEERLSPEDTPEDAAADAADEAAESAAAKQASGGKLTVEDVRRTMGLYVNRYGMAAAQVDGQEVFKRVIGESTMVDDKGNARGWRASDLPDDQAVLAKMVSGFDEMTTKNPFNRDVVEKVA